MPADYAGAKKKEVVDNIPIRNIVYDLFAVACTLLASAKNVNK